MKKASPAPKAEILARLATGESLRSICRTPGFPDHSTVCEWLRNNAEFANQYARARSDGLDVLADQALEIADDTDEDANSRRVRIDTRKWYLSKLRPEKYGDLTRTQISGPDGGPVKHSGKFIIELVEAPKPKE